MSRQFMLPDPKGSRTDRESVLAVAAAYGLTPPGADEIGACRAIGATRISDAVVTEERFAAVQAITGASLFAFREEGVITGVLAFFFLRPAGLAALQEGRFDPQAFDLDLVARSDEPVAAAYAWGFAATTAAGGKAVVKGAAAIQEGLTWAIPVFTRVATDDGARVLYGNMGYVPVPGADPSLAVRPARAAPVWSERAAA